MAKSIVIEPSGKARVEQIKGFKHLRELVGGDLEGINFGEDAFAYLNEEGKILKLPYNKRASDLCASREIGLLPGDYIVGNFVIVGPADFDGDETDAPEYLVKEIVG